MLILSLAVVATACNQQETANKKEQADFPIPKKDTTVIKPVAKQKSREDEVLDSILKLPFIVAANKNIDSVTHHKSGIAFLIDSAEKEWMIQAGYNGSERFETYHRLYVNPSTMQIKVYDVVNDEKMSVADYMKKDDK
jgi:hypothetical protein